MTVGTTPLNFGNSGNAIFGNEGKDGSESDGNEGVGIGKDNEGIFKLGAEGSPGMFGIEKLGSFGKEGKDGREIEGNEGKGIGKAGIGTENSDSETTRLPTFAVIFVINLAIFHITSSIRITSQTIAQTSQPKKLERRIQEPSWSSVLAKLASQYQQAQHPHSQ